MNTDWRKVQILFFTLMLVMFSNCWYYSFKGTLPPHIKNIAIPLFRDNTAEFNIQQIVTEQIQLGFIRENILKLVEEANSHSILTGTVESITDNPLTYSASNTGETVDEYRITVKIKAEWYDLVEDKSMFNKQFSGYSEYDPSGGTDRTREVALNEAIDNINEDIINAILGGW